MIGKIITMNFLAQLLIHSRSDILRKKLADPLFYFGIITLGFWLADTYLKLFILHAPLRMFWYSSVGLGLTALAFFSRNSLLITAMFCALAVNEGLWTISFLLKAIFGADVSHIAEYMFQPSFPTHRFIISLYHLILVPSLTLAFFVTRKVHSLGFAAAYIFALAVGLLSYLFPDPEGNVNCMQRAVEGSCQVYFSFFYPASGFWPVLTVVTGLALFVYLPVNLLLVFMAKRLKWKVLGEI